MKGLFVILSLFLCFGKVEAQVQTWKINSDHSSANFKIKWFSVTAVPGKIVGMTGEVKGDPKKPSELKISAQLDAATIDTNNEKRDAHLKTKDFFHVEEYPKILFESSEPTELDEKQEESRIGIEDGKVTWIKGTLTIHGKSKEVKLKIDEMTDPVKKDNGDWVRGVTASTRVDRRDFAIGKDYGKLSIGYDVDITLYIALEQKASKAKKR